MAFKLKSGNKTSFKEMGSKPKDNIGEGFMRPPYKKPVGPTEKAKGYHGYKNFDSIIEKAEDAKGVTTNIKTPKVMKDGSSKRTHWTAPDGTRHTGQVSDYEHEKTQDKKMKSPNKMHRPDHKVKKISKKQKAKDIGGLDPNALDNFKPKGPKKKSPVKQQIPTKPGESYKNYISRAFKKSKDPYGKDVMDKRIHAKQTADKVSKKPVSKVSGTKQALKNTPKQFAKRAKYAGKQLAKRLGPVGAAVTAYEVGKTIPKVTKATKKGLKERTKKETETGYKNPGVRKI